ncbi:MAG: outer membrane protein transport protein [Paraperlucidibaca sp.]|jgi:long-chain fatty acid transport protein|nr:outer membrane protein transport protein [Paraperlucidibaca sp.]MBQ0842731.1 outer membrane protein transport protein [Paraperlucidibaca sp.]
MTSPASRIAFVLLAAMPISAMASLGTVATNFGLTPTDTASAQALSMFSNQPSAVYYNPAYLARDRKGAMTAGFVFTEQELTAKGWESPDKIILDGDVIENDSNYNVILGFKTDLSTMLKGDRAMVLGFMLGAERSGYNLLSFSSTSQALPQSLRYGQQSLFLSVGAGINVIPGIDIGAASRITLAASANLGAQADLNGTTRYESLEVSAKPSIQPILSANINWGQLVCPEDKYCVLNGLETAVGYRYESSYSAIVDAQAVATNAVGLPLLLNTIDAYQPETFSAGIQYNFYKIRLAASGEYQMWSGLNDAFKSDTIKDQGNLQFKDVFVPRAGFELRMNDVFSFTGGVSYEQSPLESTTSLDVNYVDNDRLVFGLGFSYLIEQAMFLSQPVRLDFGYQYHILKDRDFLLATTQGADNQTSGGGNGGKNGCPENPISGKEDKVLCEGVTSGGNVHVLNASINLTF